MKHGRLSVVVAGLIAIAIAGCSDTKLFWDVDEGRDASASQRGRTMRAPSRPPLDVPPALRTEVTIPQPDRIGAAPGSPLPPRYRRLVAGEAVRLDARFYPDRTPAELFDAVVDAMTALNLPVAGVDSAAGVITTDWIRHGKRSAVVLFGFSTHNPVRYRFVVRIYRAQAEDGRRGAQLEIRTIGQVFDNGAWRNRPIRAKPVRELFDAVGERLAAPLHPTAARRTPSKAHE